MSLSRRACHGRRRRRRLFFIPGVGRGRRKWPQARRTALRALPRCRRSQSARRHRLDTLVPSSGNGIERLAAALFDLLRPPSTSCVPRHRRYRAASRGLADECSPHRSAAVGRGGYPRPRRGAGRRRGCAAASRSALVPNSQLISIIGAIHPTLAIGLQVGLGQHPSAAERAGCRPPEGRSRAARTACVGSPTGSRHHAEMPGNHNFSPRPLWTLPCV